MEASHAEGCNSQVTAQLYIHPYSDARRKITHDGQPAIQYQCILGLLVLAFVMDMGPEHYQSAMDMGPGLMPKA